jgi:hypothetical protein
MKSSQIPTTSYKEIIKEVYDNPKNLNVVKILDEAGFKKEQLLSYTLNDTLNGEEVEYIKKFLHITTLSLQ